MTREQEILARLARIEEMLGRLLGERIDPPPGMSSTAARLIALARRDPDAAKAEAKRLARASR